MIFDGAASSIFGQIGTSTKESNVDSRHSLKVNIHPASFFEGSENEKSRGLYKKYNVSRTDGKPIKGQAIVLEVRDPRTWPALEAWAETMEADGFWDAAEEVREEISYYRERARKLVKAAQED